MEVYTENYGADADGNRGVKTTFAELDESDNEAVIEKLYKYFVDGTTDGKFEIEIDGFDFDVYLDEYLDGLIEKAEADEDYKDDVDFQEWLKELKKVSK